MQKRQMTCPACGAPHEWTLPLPQTITCGNCKSMFSSAGELRRFTIHICGPGRGDEFLESHHSGRPFMVPRRGDVIRSPYINVKDGESLRVADVEFEFPGGAEGQGGSQVVYVLTEIRKE